MIDPAMSAGSELKRKKKKKKKKKKKQTKIVGKD